MKTARAGLPDVHEATREEGHAILDRAAREQLGMTGQQFLEAWHRNAFGEKPDRPEVMNVAMLIPFAR